MTSTSPKKIRCAKCGACTVVCPVFKASGSKEAYSARGKNHLATVAEYEQPTAAFEDIFAKCLLCGACSKACPRGIDVTREVIRTRSGFSRFYGEHGFQKYLARKALHHPEILGAARVAGRAAAALLLARLPKESGLRLRLAMFDKVPATLPTQVARPADRKAGMRPLAYFPGCSAEYLYPEIVAACREIFGHFSYTLEIPEGLGCCGLAVQAAGDVEGARALARRNIEALEAGDAPILISCGSCFAHLTHYQELFTDDPVWLARAEKVGARLVEMSQFLDELLASGGEKTAARQSAKPVRVFYHDPCHLRNDLDITREPRRILTSLPGVELLELPDGPQCCGQGGLFHLGAPELSARIRDDLAAKVLAMRPDVITSTCSGCLMQWKSAIAAADTVVPVLHLAEFMQLRIGS